MRELLCGTRDNPAQCAQLTLAVRILPRGLRRGEDLLSPHRTHATNKVRAIDLVSVPDNVLRCRVVGKGVHQLLACPLRGRPPLCRLLQVQ